MHSNYSSLISIIIPCFNCEQFVSRAVESVLSQTYTNWELILVNNNSTDNTQQILENYKKRLPEKVFLFQELKKGAPAARNKGLREAKGDYIQYLDADDELLEGKLSHQLNLIKGFRSDVVVGRAKQVRIVNGKKYENVRSFHPDAWLGLIFSTLGITSANLWRRQDLVDVGGWDESLSSSQEYDLMFRLLKLGAKFAFDDNVFTVVNKMESSVSASTDVVKMQQILENRIQLRLDIKEYLNSKQTLTKERATAIDKYIYRQLMANLKILPEYVKLRLRTTKIKMTWKQYIFYKYSVIKKSLID